jgi:hypothetical protein
VELDVLKSRWDHYRDRSGGLSPEALIFLLHMLPKMIQLEESFGLSTAHDEVLKVVRERLDWVEPRPAKKPKSVATKRAAPVRARAGSPRSRGAGRSGSGE